MKQQFGLLVGLSVGLGVLCAAGPAMAWDAESRDSVGGKAEWRGNTHLFIVENAIRLLAHSNDRFAQAAASYLEACVPEWRQGLWDADDRSDLVDKSNMGSHFYNPNPPDGCHTFWSVDCKDSHFDARQNAEHQLTHFSTGKSAVSPNTYGYHQRSRCYALGLALHYMTDVTMPYHAASFSGVSYPLQLHPTLESYVPVVQHRYVVNDWTPTTSGTPDELLVQAAKQSAGLFHKLRKATADSSDYCAEGSEPGGLLCYPKCKAGFTGGGPMCWESCPANFTDTGAHCLKPRAYGRGVGYPWKFGDAFNLDPARVRCEKDNGKGHCEKSGLIYYPKCHQGFHAFACCVCTPNCPAGMTDIGVSCQKHSYGRGVGEPRTLCTYTSQIGITYTGPCYRHKSGVDAAIGEALELAQRNTASYLQAVFRANPSIVPEPSQTSPAPGNDGSHFAAIWVQQAGPAFVARHGLTSEQYQQEFDKLVGQQGYCLVDVSGYEVQGQPHFAAIWEHKSCPAFVARHGLTSQQYQEEFNKLVGQQGFRLKLVNGYTVAGQDRYAAIWEKSPGPAFVARHGLTAQQYQQEFDKLVGQQHYCLSMVSGYSVGNQDRYAAIWENKSCPAFVARHGLTAQQYQQEFDKLVGQGYHLTLVNGHTVNGAASYAAIWTKSPSPAFVARHGLTAQQYQQEFDKLVGKDKLRLAWVSGY